VTENTERMEAALLKKLIGIRILWILRKGNQEVEDNFTEKNFKYLVLR
jgi:hypothetical protein